MNDTKVNSKIVRLLPPGTTVKAINDNDERVSGTVEMYRFQEYTLKSGKTTHDIEYRVRWSDGLLEWLPWSEINEYEPQRPVHPQHRPTLRTRERQPA